MRIILHNSWHHGDVLLTRPIIQAIRDKHRDVTIQCQESTAYLVADLGLPIIHGGSNWPHSNPPPSTPGGVTFVNLWFGTFQDILHTYGMTYVTQVHTFNRRMHEIKHHDFLSLPAHIPMVSFAYRSGIQVLQNSILVENGNVFSQQSNIDLNIFLPELSKLYPNINFYCSSVPPLKAPNLIDCSRYNLIELSFISNFCKAFITRGSGVNAATYTEANRNKPRCLAGWTYRIKIWDDNFVIAHTKDEIYKFVDSTGR